MKEESETRDDVLLPEQDAFPRTLGQFAAGVTIITAMSDDEPAGVAANSCTSVSLNPPLVLFCVARSGSAGSRSPRRATRIRARGSTGPCSARSSEPVEASAPDRDDQAKKPTERNAS